MSPAINHQCDEGQPACLMCAMSGRDCTYALRSFPDNTATSGPPNIDQPIKHSLKSLRVSTKDVTPSSSAASTPDTNTEDVINLNHMELLIHLTTNRAMMFNLGDNRDIGNSGISIGLNRGLEYPYLLYQLLAFSARHLAFLHPERSASYLHQAVTLQTRAISMFNASQIHVDQSNCVAIVLFSISLGHHILADTLSKREPGGLEAFMTHYLQCADIHSGIFTIAMTAWPLLMESELELIMLRSSGYTSRTPSGNHCQKVTELINSSTSLTDGDRSACLQAIRYLQLGFDAILAPEATQEEHLRYQMCFLWTVLVPPEFTRLLAVYQPEALVLLSYYALLLHYGRNMWQVGSAGEYIMGLISRYLGPKWDRWIEYPVRAMQQ